MLVLSSFIVKQTSRHLIGCKNIEGARGAIDNVEFEAFEWVMLCFSSYLNGSIKLLVF